MSRAVPLWNFLLFFDTRLKRFDFTERLGKIFAPGISFRH
jgi:hypothetical protein